MFILVPLNKNLTMKKLAFIALMASATFVACSEDETVSVNQNQDIQGTWKLTSFNMNSSFDINGDNNASSSLIAETGCYNNSTIVFDGNTTAIFNMEELEIDMQMVVGSENEMEFTFDCGSAIPFPTTYAATENSVTLMSDEDPEPLVLTRSGNTLTVVIPEATQIPVEEENGSVTYDFVGATLVWTKQ